MCRKNGRRRPSSRKGELPAKLYNAKRRLAYSQKKRSEALALVSEVQEACRKIPELSPEWDEQMERLSPALAELNRRNIDLKERSSEVDDLLEEMTAPAREKELSQMKVFATAAQQFETFWTPPSAAVRTIESEVLVPVGS